MVRNGRTAVRSLVVLLITGLWVGFSGWVPAHRFAEEREHPAASGGLPGGHAIAAENRERGESNDAPRFDAAESPQHTSCSILFASRVIALGDYGTDAVPFAARRSTRARGPPTSRT